MAREFFQKIFGMEHEDLQDARRLEGQIPVIDPGHMEQLVSPVLDDEVKTTIFKMKPYKAPGPDGYQPISYQSQWKVVGQSFCRYIREVFTGNMEMSQINHSYLVLILKTQMPEYLHQFRPIGLCNVIFKVVTQVIVGRLKNLMPKLISEVQSSFVPERHIIDNIIVAQKLFIPCVK